MARMKGAELITEYLIASGIPYVFGICGHGNVGMLDPLYQARDRIKLISPRRTNRSPRTWPTLIFAYATSRSRRSPPAAPVRATS